MKKGGTRRQFLAGFTATIGFFIAGTLLGWANPTLPRLVKGESEPHITSDESSWVVSLLNIGQIGTPVLGGYLVNLIGRKMTLITSSVPLLVAWVLVITAKSVGVLYGARVIAGLGVGLVFTVGPMYLGEIAEDHIRGTLGALFQTMLSIGVMFEVCVGPYTSTTLLGIVSAVFPVLFAATCIWIPESPYYYLLKDRRVDAEKSLQWLRSASHPDSIQEELNKMEQFVQEDKLNRGGIIELFQDRGSRKALVIAVSLIMFQNFSGVLALLAYSTHVFEASNTSMDANESVIITSGVQLVLAVVSTPIVDIAGRRPMMIVSSVGCAVALAGEGLFFYLKTETDVDISGLDWLPITGILLFLIFFTVGLGSVPILIQGELFPTTVKGIGTSITATILGGGGAIVTKLFQVFSDAWGVHVVFWMFTVSCTDSIGSAG